MRAEVIAIGDELTSGQRLDTNSQWLSEQLAELGVEVLYHSTVGDDLQANIDVFRIASQRAEIVISTGGLGPTADDLTRESMAAMLGVELEEDAESLAWIRDLFVSRGRTMPPKNRVQAMFPKGSKPIPNPAGTAPGVLATVPREGKSACRFFALPGVPAEMREMWEATVRPEIAQSLDAPSVIRHRRIKCFGVGESHLEAMLPDLIRRGREPRVGITASGATLTLRITASGSNEADCFAKMESTVATIHEKLGTLVYGSEDDELQDVVIAKLAERGETVATIEDPVTSGLVAGWLAAADESLVAYRTGQFRPDLGDLAEAAQMLRQDESTDYAIAVGRGIDPGQPTLPAIQVSLASPQGVQSEFYPLAGHPSIQRTRAAKHAINLLRLFLIDPSHSDTTA